MRGTERWFLILLIAFAGASFLPWWRGIHFAGISLFGWWMAALMVLSPLGALIIFFFERRRNGPETQDLP